jgi:peptidyl-dipeptidase Dcp
MRRLVLMTSLAVTLLACTQIPERERSTNPAPEATMATASTTVANPGPFAERSTLPYQLPPFDKIRDGDFLPGFEAGMAAQRQEVAAIAANPEAPTFENTIVALERSGQLLGRVGTVFGNLTASNTSPTLDEVEAKMAPRLAAHSDSIYLDAALFARVDRLFNARATLGLDAESQRLLERYHLAFVRAGAKLSATDQERMRKINEQLSTLTTKFRKNVLNEVNAASVVIERREELDGFSDEQIAVAAEAANAKQLPGKWVISLTNTTGQPPLASLTNRSVRERIYKASINRGLQPGELDNRALVAEIVALRAERAKLLGYPSHAAYVLDDETAKTTTAVNGILAQLAVPAVANAKRELAEMQKLADAEAKKAGTARFELQPWDWDFYAEKLRKARYSFDEAQVRPYFELDRVLRDGVLYSATQLFGITFKERKDLPLYQSDVRVFEVFEADGSPLGLFLFDGFARDNKQGGAWMNNYVEQSLLLGNQPVVVNNLNVPKPPAGQPVLLTFDEVTTAFHEFGHALHGLLSKVRYPLIAGTNVPRDYVEYPSQYNEMWATDPKVLASYAKHYQTGAPMPKALMEKILAAGKFNQGYATTEYLAAATLDQAWHQLPAGSTPKPEGVTAFESEALRRAGLDFYAVPPRYRTTYFSHIFSSPIGYSSGYYAYIWSEVLARDTEKWFNTHGGLSRANGDYLRERILSRGYTQDALSMFQNFYGGPPDIGPLLEKRGLNPSKGT